MKRCFLTPALAAIICYCAFAQAPPPTSSHIVTNGDSAVLNFGAGAIAGSLFVARCGTIQQPKTCLNYSVVLIPPPPPPPPPGFPPPPPPPPVPLEVGGGFIPDGDLTGSFVQGTMRLSTNTSAAANPSFQRIFGGGGLISIEFTKTDEVSTHTTGTSEVRFASGFQIHSSGESTSSSASAKGKVIAWEIPLPPSGPFSFVNAQLGQNHTVQIIIAH